MQVLKSFLECLVCNRILMNPIYNQRLLSFKLLRHKSYINCFEIFLMDIYRVFYKIISYNFLDFWYKRFWLTNYIKITSNSRTSLKYKYLMIMLNEILNALCIRIIFIQSTSTRDLRTEMREIMCKSIYRIL